MMNARYLLLLLPAVLPAAVQAEEAAAPAPVLTLDPALYAEAWAEVQGAAPGTPAAAQPPATPPEGAGGAPAGAAEPAAPASPGVEDWQAAMRDAGTELADVRLLVLLQRLNPLDPPSTRAEDYAAALRLHHLMLAGNARACLALARACREGHFESGLMFLQSAEQAAVLERRAAAFQLSLPGVVPAVVPEEQPPAVGAEKQQGASR